MQWELNYREPAKEWIESLPLGNGEIGAMVSGCYDGAKNRN